MGVPNDREGSVLGSVLVVGRAIDRPAGLNDRAVRCPHKIVATISQRSISDIDQNRCAEPTLNRKGSRGHSSGLWRKSSTLEGVGMGGPSNACSGSVRVLEGVESVEPEVLAISTYSISPLASFIRIRDRLPLTEPRRHSFSVRSTLRHPVANTQGFRESRAKTRNAAKFVATIRSRCASH
jgi:hypothetical protein